MTAEQIIAWLDAEMAEAEQIIAWLVEQACGTDDADAPHVDTRQIDTVCMSAYENAVLWLAERGRVTLQGDALTFRCAEWVEGCAPWETDA